MRMTRMTCVVAAMVAVGAWGVGRAQVEKPVVWQAKWIAAAGADAKDPVMPLFCKSLVLKKKPVKALLYVSALGQGEVHLNGVKVGQDEIAPGWTNYKKTVRYEQHDVMPMLTVGENIIAVMVGNGMYNAVKTPHRFTKFVGSFGVPKVLLQLEMTYADGSREVIASDATWKSAAGPIVFSSTYGGEDYDATKEVAAWDRVGPGFRDADWKDVAVVDGPDGKLEAEVAPPVRVTKTYPAVKETEVKPGVKVYDFGQNFAGWPEVTVQGARGAVVKMIPGDLLAADGTVSQRSSGSPAWFSYTLKGEGVETWRPRFSYYGLRWVQVEVAGEATVEKMQGEAISSSSKVTGAFQSSSPMLNAIHKLIVEAMHNNEVSLFTDCPHREKLGWLEETHLVAPGLMYENDLRGLYAATRQNMADAQHEDGGVPTTAPQYTVFGKDDGGKWGIFDDSPEWGSAVVLAPWAAYRFYGDVAELRKAYPAMTRYVAYLEGKATGGIVAYGLGDWFDIGPRAPGVSQLTSPGVTGTLMLYEDARDLARIAVILGKTEDASRYAALASREKDLFNARFFDAKAQVYDKGSQAAQAMPLALGVVPAEARQAVLDKLIADIHAHQDHTTAGEVGFAYIVRALIDAGRGDVLLAMMLRKDAPSYGSQLAAGATALTEAWDSKTGSQDHFMLGAGDEWFYRGLLGIDVDRSRRTGEQLVVKPEIVEGLDWVKGSYESSMGMVAVGWKRGQGKVELEVEVPANAVIGVPLLTGYVLSPVDGEKGLTRLRTEGRTLVYGASAGMHRFVLTTR
jgi:alpha-L-rhamnosidase